MQCIFGNFSMSSKFIEYAIDRVYRLEWYLKFKNVIDEYCNLIVVGYCTPLDRHYEADLLQPKLIIGDWRLDYIRFKHMPETSGYNWRPLNDINELALHSSFTVLYNKYGNPITCVPSNYLSSSF
jgi:hypothetical protein